MRETGSGAIGVGCARAARNSDSSESRKRWKDGSLNRKETEERRWQWELKRAVGSITGKFRALCSFGPDTATSIPASVKLPALEKGAEGGGYYFTGWRLQVSKKGIRGRKV